MVPNHIFAPFLTITIGILVSCVSGSKKIANEGLEKQQIEDSIVLEPDSILQMTSITLKEGPAIRFVKDRLSAIRELNQRWTIKQDTGLDAEVIFSNYGLLLFDCASNQVVLKERKLSRRQKSNLLRGSPAKKHVECDVSGHSFRVYGM